MHNEQQTHTPQKNCDTLSKNFRDFAPLRNSQRRKETTFQSRIFKQFASQKSKGELAPRYILIRVLRNEFYGDFNLQMAAM
jgi:hypothetical protein